MVFLVNARQRRCTTCELWAGCFTCPARTRRLYHLFVSLTMPIPIENQRFKQIRESLNLTQTAFAGVLGLSGSTADIERGKIRLTGSVVKELFRLYNINPLWLYGDSKQRTFSPEPGTIVPKVVSVSPNGTENILLVNVKAAAGYPHNLNDTSWYEELPAFFIPLPEFRNASFRGFQIEGDSMEPLFKTGEWVLGKSVNRIQELSPDSICILVLHSTIVLKKVSPDLKTRKATCVSLNPSYPPFSVDLTDIQEIWQVNSRLSFDLTPTTSAPNEISELQNEVHALRKEMKQWFEHQLR